MKKIIIAITAIFAVHGLWAQPLCPVKEGMVLTYATKDAKNKVKNFSRQTVTSVEGSGNDMVVTISAEALDAKKKRMSDVPLITYKLKVQNGNVVLDPKALLNSVAASTPFDATAEGTPMVLPADMKAGDVLPDCEMKMQVSIVKLNASYTNGLCEGDETITTDAGTFHCKKTTYDCKSSAMGIKQDLVIHSWYAPGIGSVKQVVYDKKGKPSTIQELVEVNNGRF